MLNPTVVGKFVDDLEIILNTLWLVDKPQFNRNCGETGKQLEHTHVQVVAKKDSRNILGRTSNERSNITIMACAISNGDKMPPMLIVKGKTSKSLFGYNTADSPNNTLWIYQLLLLYWFI